MYKNESQNMITSHFGIFINTKTFKTVEFQLVYVNLFIFKNLFSTTGIINSTKMHYSLQSKWISLYSRFV